MELEDKIILAMATLIVMGYGYSMDMPQALQTQFRQPPYSFTSLEFNFLYFTTYFPVLLTDIPLGILLDKFPMQKTVIIIAIISFASELLTAILIDFMPPGYLYLTYVLRAFVGIAGSCAFTIQGFVFARYGAQHFQMLAGFGLCVPYIMDSINSMVTPLIFDATNSVSLPLYVGAIFDFLAVIAALIIAKVVTSKQKRKQSNVEQEQQQFKVSYLLQLPRLFWIVILALMCNQILFGIYTNLNDLINNRFNISYTTTGLMLLIPYMIGSIFALIFGKMLEMNPKSRRNIILTVSFVLSGGILLLYIINNTSQPSFVTYFVIVLFLLSFSMFSGSLYSVLTSTVSNLADKKRLGTAWGVVGTAIGLGQSISPLINGLVQKDDDLIETYTTLTLVYLFLSMIPLCFAVYFKSGNFIQMDKTFDQIHNQQQKSLLKSTLIQTNQVDQS